MQHPSFDFNKHCLQLVNSGEDFFYLLNHLLKEAKTEIHLQTYIFEEDNTGKEVIKNLIAAAQRNVKVYIALDSYGSGNLTARTIEKLRENGIQLHYFAPLISTHSFYIGRRLHHKVVVADKQKALVGGINIADKYRGSSNIIPWLDYAVYVQGNVANELREICLDIFEKDFNLRFQELIRMPITNKLSGIQILQNDWYRRKNNINKSYLRHIKASSEEIILVASYFLPGRRLRVALRKAAKRGVKVKIILAGVSDVPIVKYATLFFYDFLLMNGIEIYEWRKSVLHGKVGVIDKQWITVGSFNLNHLSAYGSVELNLGIQHKPMAAKAAQHFAGIIEQCVPIKPEEYKQGKTTWFKIKKRFAFGLVRFAMMFATSRIYQHGFNSHR